MLKILSAVSEERLGYSYGKPLRVDEKSLAVVLPILRNTSIPRPYITFPETEKVLVFDTGSIQQMEAENKDDKNVFIRSGTLFRGSTQERALLRSAVIFPGKRMPLAVRCVHASRGINPGSNVTYGGITPLDFDKANYTSGYTPKDQSAFWSNVSANTIKMSAKMGKKVKKSAQSPYFRSSARGMSAGGMSMSASAGSHEAYGSDFDEIPVGATSLGGAFLHEKTDDLFTTFSEFSKHFDAVLSKVKLVENQAGLALISHVGVETIEFFDHADSWKALHEAAVKRLGNNIVPEPGESVFEFKPENAIKQVNRVLALNWGMNQIYRHRPSNGEPEVEITGLSCENFVGEAVEVNGTLIHLVILRQE